MPENKSVIIYGLSTCVHCRHAKELCEELQVPFECVFVDKLQGEERADTLRTVKKYNPRLSFPTILITPGEKVLVGFVKDEALEALRS